MEVSHSLIAGGTVWLKPTVSRAQVMKGGAHPFPFAALAFPNSKKVPFTAGLTEKIFQSSHVEF